MKRGFTLVEILIAMAILMIMVVILIGTLNPVVYVQKSNDIRRKKDLGRIKIALEEYYNDKKCYPPQDIVAQLRDKTNCYKSLAVFPQLAPWVCDPKGSPYFLVVPINTNCPKEYKIMANLEYNKDPSLLPNWDLAANSLFGYVGNLVPGSLVNYGAIGGNGTGNWYDTISNLCQEAFANGTGGVGAAGCFHKIGSSCNGIGLQPNCNAANGERCYLDSNCKDVCSVSSCGNFF